MGYMSKLLFIGDSLIEFFDWGARFPEHLVHNLGIAGETVDGLARRLDRVLRDLDAVDRVFIMSGINNLAMEDSGFIGTYRGIIRSFAVRYPAARITVQSLLPVLYPFISNEDIQQMNLKLKSLAAEEGVGYVNLHDHFLDDNGNPDPSCLVEDGVHVSNEGYRIWSGEIEKLLG
ncbi:MAG: GDSL family lipase [Thermodesulfovibrio sp.]|nr:GDSL family lipase [Thermodesulfovibrio sp.]